MQRTRAPVPIPQMLTQHIAVIPFLSSFPNKPVQTPFKHRLIQQVNERQSEISYSVFP